MTSNQWMPGWSANKPILCYMSLHVPSKVATGITDATGIPVCQRWTDIGLCFSAAGTLSQPASRDLGKSQTYRTIISMLQTHERVLFKTFSFVVRLNWIIHAPAVAAHLQCSTCPSVYECVGGCLILKKGFFSSQKKIPDCGEDPQSSTLKVITPGKLSGLSTSHQAKDTVAGKKWPRVSAAQTPSNPQQLKLEHVQYN